MDLSVDSHRLQGPIPSRQPTSEYWARFEEGGRGVGRVPVKGDHSLGGQTRSQQRRHLEASEGKRQSTRPGILGSLLHPSHPVLPEVEKCEDCASQS